MKCRICGRKILSGEYLAKVNIEVCNVFSSPVVTPKVDVVIYTCPDCGHHQIENIFKEDHYEKYNLLNVDSTKTSGGGNASLRISYYETVLRKLKDLSGASDKVLDVGCGHGEILCKAKEIFRECVGVEPSESECVIARQNVGHNSARIVNAFFDDAFEEDGFDVVVATQVFEHLDAPRNVMQNAFRVLKPGGVAYFDVPNGQKIYNNSEYYNIYAEHVNYYTQSSLAYLTRISGFDILGINEIFDGNHLAIYVRKPKMHIGFEKTRSKYMDKLKNGLKSQGKISVWGCGIKGRNFISSLPLDMRERITFLFDSNPNISGCFVNDCKVPISIPTKEKIEASNAIILTATEYKNEIVQSLHDRYQFRGKLILLDDELPK